MAVLPDLLLKQIAIYSERISSVLLVLPVGYTGNVKGRKEVINSLRLLRSLKLKINMWAIRVALTLSRHYQLQSAVPQYLGEYHQGG